MNKHDKKKTFFHQIIFLDWIVHVFVSFKEIEEIPNLDFEEMEKTNKRPSLRLPPWNDLTVMQRFKLGNCIIPSFWLWCQKNKEQWFILPFFLWFIIYLFFFLGFHFPRATYTWNALLNSKDYNWTPSVKQMMMDNVNIFYSPKKIETRNSKGRSGQGFEWFYKIYFAAFVHQRFKVKSIWFTIHSKALIFSFGMRKIVELEFSKFLENRQIKFYSFKCNVCLHTHYISKYII